MSVFDAEQPVCEGDKHIKDHQKKGQAGFLFLFFFSPIAILLLILAALLSLLQFLFKAMLLFSIVAMNTPFAMMLNASILVIDFKHGIDPRVAVGIEFKAIVSNFFKVMAEGFLLIVSTGVITFYTAPIQVFYISIAGGVAAIVLKWLNTNSLSKTAFSCLCSGFGLDPMMFFFSFIGLFDIGCHPVAKCSFTAHKAFLFTKEAPNPCIPRNVWKPFMSTPISSLDEMNIVDLNIIQSCIEFPKWNAFERGLFQLCPRIKFDIRLNKEGEKKFILKSFMVLKLPGWDLSCECPVKKLLNYKYPVERLELPVGYSKVNELYNFLVDLSSQDGFVTDRMRGRYEQSLTLLEIVDGVEKSVGYEIMKPVDERFVVAGYTD